MLVGLAVLSCVNLLKPVNKSINSLLLLSFVYPPLSLVSRTEKELKMRNRFRTWDRGSISTLQAHMIKLLCGTPEEVIMPTYGHYRKAFF